MSRQVRNRVTAIVLGGFLLGAAVVTTGTANAEQIEGAGRQVVFAGGGMLGFSCRSSPSVESMTIPAQGTVRFVNRTGRGANLVLNGDSHGMVADDASTEVMFRRGTTAVLLEPECASADESTPVVVTTTPPTAPTPGDVTQSPDEEPDDGSASPSDPDTPPASGSQPPPASSTQSPVPSPSKTQVSAPGQVGGTYSAAPSLPLGGMTADVKGRSANGTQGSDVPAFADMPVGEDRVLLDNVRAETVPVTTTDAEPAQEAEPAREIAAAEPVAAMAPMPESAPIGLLALVASVCVLGVGTGAIRAFVSQRASRASLA